jgi:hypothetical protein
VTATLLQFPYRPRTVRLLTLDGRPWARTDFPEPCDAWDWIARTVAAELDCSPEDVGATEEDVVTVHGMPCYVLRF